MSKNVKKPAKKTLKEKRQLKKARREAQAQA